MSEIKVFFRFCPDCGRRFHIKLVRKDLVNVEREQEEPGRSFVMNPSPGMPSPGYPPIVVQEGEPVTIDIEEFQYVYKCGHCGHVWEEKHVEEVEEK